MYATMTLMLASTCVGPRVCVHNDVGMVAKETTIVSICTGIPACMPLLPMQSLLHIAVTAWFNYGDK